MQADGDTQHPPSPSLSFSFSSASAALTWLFSDCAVWAFFLVLSSCYAARINLSASHSLQAAAGVTIMVLEVPSNTPYAGITRGWQCDDDNDDDFIPMQ